ncbi:MAG: hypothetical protein ACLS6Q_01365 [Christensenellaceae bacterium]
MTTKKYEFTGEVKFWAGVTLRRIRATEAFGYVEAGELGGWIEKEENLSRDGSAWVSGNAEVYLTNHLLVVGAIGSRNGFTTFYRDKDNEITVTCGCFLGKIDRFLEKVTETHGDSKHALAYRAAAELAKIQIELSEEEVG